MACGGSVSSSDAGRTTSPGDSGSRDAGVINPHDASAATPDAAGRDARVPDACTPVGFDASGYALTDGGPAPTIGSPCLPAAENVVDFPGFELGEVSVEQLSANEPSGGPVCLIDHFQGRVSCPYGENAAGEPPSCALPCRTPSGQAVAAPVVAQCVNVPSAASVYWSCRCADSSGNTNDGTYCTCPSSMTCKPLIATLGDAEDDDISGSYCVLAGAPAPGTSCAGSCDPTTAPCP
jgi:hypothetical protein